MSWILRLPPASRAILLFGFVGMPLGAIIFLAGVGIVEGKPLVAFGILRYPGIALALTVFFGGIPGIATGAIALCLRSKCQSVLGFALVMMATGAAITALYLLIVVMTVDRAKWWPEILILVGGIAATGGVTAFFCALLFNRWLAPSNS